MALWGGMLSTHFYNVALSHVLLEAAPCDIRNTHLRSPPVEGIHRYTARVRHPTARPNIPDPGRRTRAQGSARNLGFDWYATSYQPQSLLHVAGSARASAAFVKEPYRVGKLRPCIYTYAVS